MEPIPPCDLQPRYTTLDEIRAEHSRLLDADSGDEAPGPEFWREVRSFATRVAESGVYFDEPHEIKACQGYLGYWERELSRAKAETRFGSDLEVPGLRSYDEAALRALQPRYANPFERFAEDARALLQDNAHAHATAELAKLIERQAADAGLRFELDLVKEIAGQVAGDSYAPTLVEFCLYHLFECPQTRIGNKLRRPPGERSFSCLQYLVDQADRIHADQEPSEQQAMLDALAAYGNSYDPGGKSGAMIPRRRIDAVTGAASSTFKDSAGRALALTPFLVASRVVFEHGPNLSIVHPALFRRWPELLAEVRVRKDRGQRSRRVRLYGAVLGAVALLAVALSLYATVLGEKDQKKANDMAASAYRELWEFEACRVGRKAARNGSKCEELLESALARALSAIATAPTSRAMAALNETIGAMLGADVRAWRKETLPKSKPLAWRGTAPVVVPCPPERQGTGAVCLVDSLQHGTALPGLSWNDNPFVTDIGEKHIALAWPAFDSNTRQISERVGLAAFVDGQKDGARPVGKIVENRCQQRSVSHVRLSADGRMASLDCAGATKEEGQPLWDVIPLSEDLANRSLIPPARLQTMREDDTILAVYFADAREDGYAIVKDGGEVEVFTQDDEEPVASYQSDFLRLTGRPENLALHPTAKDGFAALGNAVNLDHPVIVIHDEQGRDRTYIAPSGLGTPQRVDYSPNGKCVEVRTVDSRKNAFSYHIVLDPAILTDVAMQITGATPRYEARSLCGFEEAK